MRRLPYVVITIIVGFIFDFSVGVVIFFETALFFIPCCAFQ